MKYGVTFTQYHYYEVEAENEWEGLDKAHELFYRDARSPIAYTHYDEWEIDELDCEEEEEDYE